METDQGNGTGPVVGNDLAQETATPAERVLGLARKLFDQQPRPHWVGFYRAVCGVDGIIRKVFPDRSALRRFYQSAEYRQVAAMLERVRREGDSGDDETTRVITVRLPASVHAALKSEAHDESTSMNALCVGKLLKPAGGADF